MYHLVYVSSAVKLMSEADLKEILTASRRNNTLVGITGILLYLEGNFIQVLEGEKGEVDKTHARISNDNRHHGLITLLQGEIQAREFAEWSMGFKQLTKHDVNSIPGCNDFLIGNLDVSIKRSAVLRLLETFRSINK